MVDERPPGFATRAIHGGGADYDRLTVEQRLALLEGGTAAVAVPSGPPLLMVALQPVMRPGDQLIAASQFGSAGALAALAPGFGWDVRLADVDDPAAFERAVTPKTQAILVESMAASGEIADLGALAALAKRAQVPLVVDNTLLTPALCRPFEFDADIVLHTDTRLLAGEAGAAGFIIDGGRFNWLATRRYPAMTEPRAANGGTAFAEDVGNFAHAAACRALVGDDAPFPEAGNIAAGLETLSLRMLKHSDNARAVAEFLAGHRQVIALAHAALSGTRHHGLAERYCPSGTGALVNFVVEGGHRGAERVLDRVQLIAPRAEPRAARSSLVPVLRDDGTTAGMLRLSVGLEDAADVIADLDRALAP